MRRLDWKLGLLVWSVLVAMAGCAPSTGGGKTLYLRLQDEDPAVRLDATVEAADAKDAKAVPYIVENLGSDDASMRMYSYIALKKITGMTLGYEYFGTQADREQAIKRWREWLRTGRKEVPAAASQSAARAAGVPPAFFMQHEVAYEPSANRRLMLVGTWRQTTAAMPPTRNAS
jgi:hypothetical protein